MSPAGKRNFRFAVVINSKRMFQNGLLNYIHAQTTIHCSIKLKFHFIKTLKTNVLNFYFERHSKGIFHIRQMSYS